MKSWKISQINNHTNDVKIVHVDGTVIDFKIPQEHISTSEQRLAYINSHIAKKALEKAQPKRFHRDYIYLAIILIEFILLLRAK